MNFLFCNLNVYHLFLSKDKNVCISFCWKLSMNWSGICILLDNIANGCLLYLKASYLEKVDFKGSIGNFARWNIWFDNPYITFGTNSLGMEIRRDWRCDSNLVSGRFLILFNSMAKIILWHLNASSLGAVLRLLEIWGEMRWKYEKKVDYNLFLKNWLVRVWSANLSSQSIQSTSNFIIFFF